MRDFKTKSDFDTLLADRKGLLEKPHFKQEVTSIVDVMTTALRRGNTIYWCGNGGSASQANHMAAEFSGRFLRERQGWASESLSSNNAAITAIANDYGYDNVFARQVEAFAEEGDVLVGLSTSGKSPNIINAFKMALKLHATTIGFIGNGGGEMALWSNYLLTGPYGYSAIIQEIHEVMAHIIIHLVEQELLAL